jgi:elongator complex protein 4
VIKFFLLFVVDFLQTLVISSIGGLIWNDSSTLNESYSHSMCRLLVSLRELLRHSLAVCVITVPNEIVNNRTLINKYSILSDHVFLMDDSAKSVSRLTSTEYDGIFRLVKLPRLNSLNACFVPETLDLAFYIKRKRLVVEQLHLPPELSEDDQTQKGRTSTSIVTMSCSSTTGSMTGSAKLDF